ncbi:MAG: T9SS type A sorting domain-containing protein [Ignavibacteriales bacterium]|nr:T9SS type A sorting domain-containing protein [Ignavibacteriales bacterium]
MKGETINVTLKVYDVLGNEVATLVNEYKQPGVYNSTFSTLRSLLSSGVYLYTLRAGDYVQTKKMQLLK